MHALPFMHVNTYQFGFLTLLTLTVLLNPSRVLGTRLESEQRQPVRLLTQAYTHTPDVAWIVQTGQSTAREAVVAMLLTTLQQQHNRVGLVADVQSNDIVPLVDTGHKVEDWSQQYWAVELANDGQRKTTTASQTHPQYYQHWAYKALAGFQTAYTRWPEADWYIMVEDDTYIFQATMRDFLLQFGPEQQHYMGYPVKGVSQCRDPTSPTQQENTGQVFDLAQMISQRQPADDPDKSTNQPQSIRKLLHKLRSVSPQQPGDHAHIPNQSKQDTAQQSPPAHKQQHTNTQQVHTSHSTDLTTQSRPQARASPQHGNQQMYALSGTGMILSRGAMAHFAPQLRGCMLASQDCHLDDVRLFLCLKEAGISLNTTSGYAALNLAPNRHLDWGMFDPCTQPAVFHGVGPATETAVGYINTYAYSQVDPMAMHMLWEAEQQHHGKPTMADLFAHISLWGEHSERPGLRYDTKHLLRNMTDVITSRACREACEQHISCRAWNYNPEGCFCELLDQLSKPSEQWRFDSGISQPAYVCHQNVAVQ